MSKKRMKVFVLFLFVLFGTMVLSAFVCSSGNTMVAEANIFADSISIEAPDYVFLGNISKGFANDYVRIDFNNTGTTNVIITPALENPSETIFNYTYFARRTTEDFSRIGSFNLNISKPATFGGKRSEYCYIKLDLTNYPYPIASDMLSHKSNIIFWATAP